MFVGLTDLLKGDFTVLNNKSLAGKDLLSAMDASFTFPGVFPPAQVFDSEFYDGTTIYNLDIFSAVNECLAKPGVTEADVVVDVIMTSSSSL